MLGKAAKKIVLWRKIPLKSKIKTCEKEILQESPPTFINNPQIPREFSGMASSECLSSVLNLQLVKVIFRQITWEFSKESLEENLCTYIYIHHKFIYFLIHNIYILYYILYIYVYVQNIMLIFPNFRSILFHDAIRWAGQLLKRRQLMAFYTAAIGLHFFLLGEVAFFWLREMWRSGASSSIGDWGWW